MEGSYVKTDLKNWKESEDSRYWIERMNLIMCSAPDMRGWNAGGKGSLMVRVTLSSGVPGCCILSYMYACCGKTCEVACWSGNWKVVVMQCCRPYAGKVKELHAQILTFASPKCDQVRLSLVGVIWDVKWSAGACDSWDHYNAELDPASDNWGHCISCLLECCHQRLSWICAVPFWLIVLACQLAETVLWGAQKCGVGHEGGTFLWLQHLSLLWGFNYVYTKCQARLGFGYS